MPELDAVVAVTGQSPDMQMSMNIIWDHLPAGMLDHPLPEYKEGVAGLKKELAALTLPVTKGSVTSTSASRINRKKFVLADNDMGVRTMEFVLSDKGCQLNIGKSDKTSTLDFGWENWVLNDERALYVLNGKDFSPMPTRMAGTATWVDDKTLQLNVRMVEAIFGDRITCVFEGERLNVTFLSSIAEMLAKKIADPRKGLEGHS